MNENTPPSGSRESLDKIYQDFLQQPEQITQEQVFDIERRFTEESGVTRRAALASLARSGQDLHSTVMESDEAARAFAEMCYRIEQYVDQLKALIDLMKVAGVRLRLALHGRPDMQQLLKAAKKAHLN